MGGVVRQKPTARRGAILAMVLASLLVAGMLGLALIETVLIHHRQMQALGRQQQCAWLAEAALGRAIRKLEASSDYQGERWEVSAEVIGGEEPAAVTIQISAVERSPEARRIEAIASLPDGPRRTACRRELVVSE